jgi:hypothetical protein
VQLNYVFVSRRDAFEHRNLISHLQVS